MILDLPSAQKLAHSQDEFKRFFRLSHEEGVRFYRSLSSALFESVYATLQFYSHRNLVILHRGVSPFIQQLEGPLNRDSKRIMPLDLGALELEKDAAAVVTSADHPVTGEPYRVENMEQLAQQGRLICIKLIHRQDLVAASLQKEILPYSIEILSLSQGQILVRLGKRCKIHSFFSHLEPMVHFDMQALQAFKSQPVNSSLNHEVFRERLQDSGWEFFPSSKMSPGRSFISHSKMNSEWVLRQIQIKCPHITAELCESTSLCRWQAGNSFYDWWEGRPSDSFLRGGLVFETSCFDVPGFVDGLIELSAIPEFML